ncbi:MAG: hypothetical protein LBU89_13150 [Fibromonadaceae bacterium]|jgi:ppGpp synthetase/RelA/SpoT-type nucleotidyltranferase|nr:hypothetical protein [Fibromonadaceae bacterium]
MIEKTERLVCEINRVHLQFSNDYFETGKVQKINLSKTIASVPKQHILNYRLNLHESINDYLISTNLEDVNYFYRVKTSESIEYKISRFQNNEEQFPVNNWMNDIFGARIILCSEHIEIILTLLDNWREKYGLKNWYKRDKDGYKGIHIYFKNKNNFYFPWELQVWDKKDIEKNIENHRKFKREFV